MTIFSDDVLVRMRKNQLIDHLRDMNYDEDVSFMKKNELINTIKYKTDLYLNYTKLFRDIIEKPDKTLIGEQKEKFYSIFSFLQGITEKKKISKQLDDFFIPDISNLIVSKLEYADYPKIKDRIGLLCGGAGTGKTHLISNLNYKLDKILKVVSPGNVNTEIQVLAPTNKAIKVIKTKIFDILKSKDLSDSQNSEMLGFGNIAFSTISKFLQQDIEYTPEGHVVYKTKLNVYKNSEYKYLKYIIIDEASMISKNNWNDLNTFIFKRYPHIKILLIGDECQLPPVKEISSIVFNIRSRKFQLNEIVRTQSEEITKIYNLYRNAVINNTVVKELPEEGKDFKYITSFEDSIRNNFDVETDKLIAYSNDRVDKYNDTIRNIIFNNPTEKYVIGEKIIFGSSVRNTNTNSSVTEVSNYFYANDEATVHGITKTTLNTNFTHNEEKFDLKKLFPEEVFDIYQLHLLINGSIKIVNKIHEDCRIGFEDYFENVYERIKALSKSISKNKKTSRDYISKLWNIYYIVKYTIDIPIKYSYALTVYKSQGSTFKKIFIDMEDIHDCVKNNSVLNKTLYTAVTRASEKIYCYKPTISDYYLDDLKKFPFLKNNTRLDPKRALIVLKDGQNIMYTRNEFNSKTRKLVKGRIIHILHKRIHVGNSSGFSWELKLKDDIIIYL